MELQIQFITKQGDVIKEIKETVNTPAEAFKKVEESIPTIADFKEENKDTYLITCKITETVNGKEYLLADHTFIKPDDKEEMFISVQGVTVNLFSMAFNISKDMYLSSKMGLQPVNGTTKPVSNSGIIL